MAALLDARGGVCTAGSRDAGDVTKIGAKFGPSGQVSQQSTGPTFTIHFES